MQSSFSWDWGPAFPTVGLWYYIFLNLRICNLPNSNFRHPVKLEAYNTVSIRDWWVGFERDEIQQLWKVDMKIHCETPDSGIDHAGTFTVTITDQQQVVQTLKQETVLTGDGNRQVSTPVISFVVPFSQVTASPSLFTGKVWTTHSRAGRDIAWSKLRPPPNLSGPVE